MVGIRDRGAEAMNPERRPAQKPVRASPHRYCYTCGKVVFRADDGDYVFRPLRKHTCTSEKPMALSLPSTRACPFCRRNVFVTPSGDCEALEPLKMHWCEKDPSHKRRRPLSSYARPKVNIIFNTPPKV